MLDILEAIWKDPVWSKVISTVIIALGPYLYYRYYKKNNETVLVDCISQDNFEIERPKGWDQKEKREIGEPAEGTCIIKNGVLNIERINIEGRFLIRIIKYKICKEWIGFIKSKPELDSDRRLYVTFEAKVIGGKHTFRVMCKDINTNDWVNYGSAHHSFRISSEKYHHYKKELKVPTNVEFRIQVDDTEVEKPNTSIQIRGFKVVEFK